MIGWLRRMNHDSVLLLVFLILVFVAISFFFNSEENARQAEHQRIFMSERRECVAFQAVVRALNTHDPSLHIPPVTCGKP